MLRSPFDPGFPGLRVVRFLLRFWNCFWWLLFSDLPRPTLESMDFLAQFYDFDLFRTTFPVMLPTDYDVRSVYRVMLFVKFRATKLKLHSLPKPSVRVISIVNDNRVWESLSDCFYGELEGITNHPKEKDDSLLGCGSVVETRKTDLLANLVFLDWQSWRIW